MLASYIDNTARIDQIIRRVKYTPISKHLPDVIVKKLVVGGTAN